METRDIDRGELKGGGYLATPDGSGPHPGIVVIHEAYGLNDNIKDITRRFAEAGYVALAVDLFTDRNRAVCMARYMGGMLLGSSIVTASTTSRPGSLTLQRIATSMPSAWARLVSAWVADSPSHGPARTRGSRRSPPFTPPTHAPSTRSAAAYVLWSAPIPRRISPPTRDARWTRHSNRTTSRATSRSTPTPAIRSLTTAAEPTTRLRPKTHGRGS